jgi:hypothetical protein
VLLCQLKRDLEMPGFLTRWSDATPSDRLAAAFPFGVGFQRGLDALLFGRALGPITRTYGIF